MTIQNSCSLLAHKRCHCHCLVRVLEGNPEQSILRGRVVNQCFGSTRTRGSESVKHPAPAGRGTRSEGGGEGGGGGEGSGGGEGEGGGYEGD